MILTMCCCLACTYYSTCAFSVLWADFHKEVSISSAQTQQPVVLLSMGKQLSTQQFAPASYFRSHAMTRSCGAGEMPPSLKCNMTLAIDEFLTIKHHYLLSAKEEMHDLKSHSLLFLFFCPANSLTFCRSQRLNEQ